MLFSLNKDVSDGPDGHVAIIRTETAHVSTRRVACWKTTGTKTDSGVGGCAVVFLVAYDANSYFWTTHTTHDVEALSFAVQL